MSLSTNKGLSAPMGSQPCLKKAMQMMTLIQNQHDSPVQCHVCAHHPMCRAVLKNVTTFLKWPFLKDFEKCTHTPHDVMTCLPIKAKTPTKSQKVSKRTKLAAYECPREIWKQRGGVPMGQTER